MTASTVPIPPSTQNGSTPDQQLLSAQAVLILALIDSLSFLRVQDLKEWLPLTAQLINTISDRRMRNVCVGRFWEALSGGEMDVDRAHCCVTWWSTRGGRELVLFGAEPGPAAGPEGEEGGPMPFMSGAVGAVAPERESKL